MKPEAESLTTPTTQYVEVDDLQLAYRVVEDAPLDLVPDGLSEEAISSWPSSSDRGGQRMLWVPIGRYSPIRSS